MEFKVISRERCARRRVNSCRALSSTPYEYQRAKVTTLPFPFRGKRRNAHYEHPSTLVIRPRSWIHLTMLFQPFVSAARASSGVKIHKASTLVQPCVPETDVSEHERENGEKNRSRSASALEDSARELFFGGGGGGAGSEEGGRQSPLLRRCVNRNGSDSWSGQLCKKKKSEKKRKEEEGRGRKKRKEKRNARIC